MTLDREDIEAIAAEVARRLAPQLGVSAEPAPDPEPVPLPGSYAARKREALERGEANRKRREARERRKREESEKKEVSSSPAQARPEDCSPPPR